MERGKGVREWSILPDPGHLPREDDDAPSDQAVKEVELVQFVCV